MVPEVPLSHCEEPGLPNKRFPAPSVNIAWPEVPAVLGKVKARLEVWEEDDRSRVVKLFEALLNKSWPAVVLATPKVKAPLMAVGPCKVTGAPPLPMTTPVEEAVPMLSAPKPSTLTSASPDKPELLTVSMAWVVRVKDNRRKKIPSNE